METSSNSRGTLPAAFLEMLCDEFSDEQTAGFYLLGSHARGSSDALSDVDLNRMRHTPVASREEGYSLHIRRGRLISLKTLTIEEQYEALERPDEAIWAVPGLRGAVILRDPEGELEALVQAARDFRWEPLQQQANRHASYELAGYAEEVHKVVAALRRYDASSLAWAVTGLAFGLSRVVAVQRGVMIESENRMLDLVEAAVGDDSAWSAAHRVATGMRPADIWQRGQAALDLYVATADLLMTLLMADHHEVVTEALNLICAFQRSGLDADFGT